MGAAGTTARGLAYGGTPGPSVTAATEERSGSSTTIKVL